MRVSVLAVARTRGKIKTAAASFCAGGSPWATIPRGSTSPLTRVGRGEGEGVAVELGRGVHVGTRVNVAVGVRVGCGVRV